MKKLFLALAAFAVMFTACQKEEPTANEEVAVNLSFDINANQTRSDLLGTATSAQGGLTNLDDSQFDLRYHLEIYKDINDEPVKKRMTEYVDNFNDASAANFALRLFPGEYTFVVYADFVIQGEQVDYNYNTTDNLSNVTVIRNVINDESRDMYFYTQKINVENGSNAITETIQLRRPFGKLRVVTTDLQHLNPNTEIQNVTVKYQSANVVGFNAVTGELLSAGNQTEYTANVVDYTEVDEATQATLFVDYIFANAEQSVVHFELTTNTTDGPSTYNFTTDIPVKRNALTTIKGNVLTTGKDITVTVEDVFAEQLSNINTINGLDDLLYAVNNSGTYIVLNDLYLTSEALNAYNAPAATRGGLADAINTIIDLNGFTITVNNTNSDKALVTVPAGNTLVIAGQGAIESKGQGAFIDVAPAENGKEKGKVEISGGEIKGETVFTSNAKEDMVDYRVLLAQAFAEGGEYTLPTDVVINEPLTLDADKSLSLNLGGKTLSQAKECTASYSMIVNNGNLTIEGEGKISFTDLSAGNGSDWGSYTIENRGTLVVNNGTIEHLGSMGDWGTNRPTNIPIQNYAGKVTVNGGVISSPQFRSLRDFTAGGEIIINGGVFKGQVWMQGLGTGSQSLTITGGSFEPTYGYDGSSVYITNGTNDIQVSVSGGTFATRIGCADAAKLGRFVTGGTFHEVSVLNYLADGAHIYLAEGEYNLPVSLATDNETSGSLTIEGAGVNTILQGATNTNANNPGNYAHGQNLTFKNLTYKTANNGYNGGFGHANQVNFYNCTIIGQYYAQSGAPHYFEGCTINPLNGYLYTYASDCTFKNCHFDASEGKALQVYEDAATGENTVVIENCTFKAAKQAATWDGKPVTGIDINSNGAIFTVTISNCTTEGFPKGLNSNSDLWNNKCGFEYIKLTVDGKSFICDGLVKDANKYYVSNANGLAKLNEMFKDQSAGQSAKVSIEADIDFTGKTWTPVDSHADTKFWISEINGNGHTISNLTISGQAMFTRFAGSGDVVIKDLTFYNANVNSNTLNTSILTGQTYQDVLLDNVDVKNSTIQGAYKVAPLIATVYNEANSTITATLKNCDVENVTVKATSYDFCTTGMVAFVYADDNDKIEFEKCSVKNVKLYAPNVYQAHAAIYTTGSDSLFNEAEGVTVENVIFENI